MPGVVYEEIPQSSFIVVRDFLVVHPQPESTTLTCLGAGGSSPVHFNCELRALARIELGLDHFFE